MIARDQVLADGDTIRVGDIALQTFVTAGHTMGTASFAFDAFDALDGAKRWRAFTVGGLGLNAIRGPEQVEVFIASVKQRICSLVDDPVNPVAVHLTTHPFSSGLTEASALLGSRKPGDPHPLVDPQGFRRQLDSLQAAAEKRLAAERARKSN